MQITTPSSSLIQRRSIAAASCKSYFSIQRHGRMRAGRRAIALLETVIVLPVLLFLALGAVEFGQYFYFRNIFESAARDACRAAIPHTAVASDPAAAATRTLAEANISFTPSMMTIVDFSTNQVVTDVSTVNTGDGVSVYLTLTYSTIPNVYRPFNDMTGHGINNTKTLSTVCTMIKE